MRYHLVSRRALGIVRLLPLFIALLAALSGVGGAAPPRTEFDVRSEFGEESSWTRPYLEECSGVLISLMHNRAVAPPTKILVTLTKDRKSDAIRGAACPTALAFTSDSWPRERGRLWILSHELANLFAAHYAGAGGFPSDWWSDGRSPFPEYVSCLVMKKLGYSEEAEWRKGLAAGKKDHLLFWELDGKYGFNLFAQLFKSLREDGVNLSKIGKSGWNPDKVRSAYTIAYLSLAAKSNLAAMIREHDIGKEPNDWKQRHPEIKFVEYEVTSKMVTQILRARKKLLGKGVKRKGANSLQLYRLGHYEEALKAET
jgi:hypothetical protein